VKVRALEQARTGKCRDETWKSAHKYNLAIIEITKHTPSPSPSRQQFRFMFSTMMFKLSIVTAVALLTGQVLGKEVGGRGGLRRKTKVCVRLDHVFAVVSISF
jgi:hypothetical protein